MYKVVIIDDEPMVCRGLSERFPWKDWGCMVCGTALNGLEGKELIDRTEPDIVLTDVKMPGLTGLELAEHVQRHHPNVIIVVLSGFNEFDYARQALRHQVFDYLLKPIDKEELKSTLRKVIQRLTESRAANKNTAVIEKKLSQVNPLAEAGILMSLMLNNRHETDSMQNKMKDLGMTFQKGQVVVFDLRNVWEQHESYTALHQFALSNILHEIYERNRCRALIQWIAGKCTAALLFDAHIPSALAQKRVLEATRDGVEQAREFFNQRVFAGAGPFSNRIEDLNESYRCALLNLANGVFWELDLSENAVEQAGRSIVQVDGKLYDAISDGNETLALQEFDEVVSCLRKIRNMELVYSVCLEIVVNLSGISKSSEADLPVPSLNDLKQYTFFGELSGKLREIVSNLCRSIDSTREFIKLPLKEKILSYVQENYANPNLSLQDVADEFHLSVSHLSRMFKKEAGTNFNEYRSMIRIEKAKELLDKKYWLTSQETAYLVGFTDGKYFSQVFKKYCGMTPSEYREIKNAGQSSLNDK